QDLLLELSNAQVAEIVIGVRAVLSFRIVRHVISRPFSPQSVFQKRISISRIFALLRARGAKTCAAHNALAGSVAPFLSHHSTSRGRIKPTKERRPRGSLSEAIWQLPLKAPGGAAF